MPTIGQSREPGLLAAETGRFLERLDNPPGAEESAYVGGRGNITAQALTGLFLNPTSGTAPKGTVTAQACAAVYQLWDDATRTDILSVVSYAATDWLEVGAIGLDIENDGSSVGLGPMLRVRLLQDREGSWIPEASVGAYAFLGGPDAVRSNHIFAAFSKRFELGEAARDRDYLKSIRLHAGVRLNDREAGENDTVGYFGAEVQLWKWIHLVGEVSTEDNSDGMVNLDRTHTPFGVGIQVRHPDGIGVTLAAIQNGWSSDIGTYVGIGIGFDVLAGKASR